jgi:uncharacterized protein YodC (DUF2158 family)
MRFSSLMALAALAVTGCGSGSVATTQLDTARTEQTHAELGATVTFRVGDSVEIGSTGLRITMTGVPADSRCPTDVVCVWAGDAAVAFAFSGTASTSAALLHTTLDPKSVIVSGVTVQLLEVTPGNKSGQTIPQGDYRAKVALRSP